MEKPGLQDLFPSLQVALSEIFIGIQSGLPCSNSFIQDVVSKYLEHVSVSDGQLGSLGYRDLGLGGEITEIRWNKNICFSIPENISRIKYSDNKKYFNHFGGKIFRHSDCVTAISKSTFHTRQALKQN